jgi:hypothetical protein
LRISGERAASADRLSEFDQWFELSFVVCAASNLAVIGAFLITRFTADL